MINTSKTIDELSIEQKVHLVSGKNFWQINGIEKYNLSPIIVSDGPHGLRRAVDVTELNGNSKTIKAICFPTASAQACSFDDDLLKRLGEILGEECQAENVQVLLGPANNIKRTPLCGRNFEYYSEDPYLAGRLSSALIKGVQSKGIGTSLKHFVANNQEKSRMTIDAVIDERTLREIYLTAFEIPITESKPWTIMASYNRVNGSYVCQNEYLLKDILRNEWGYQGLVMSDWGAVDELSDSINSGLDLEMPTSGEVGPSKLIKAIKKKKLSLESLNKSTKHVIELLEKGNSNKSNGPYDLDKHHELAREIGRECIVLLKNDDQILPVTKDKYKKITIVGDFAIHPRFQGGGSSHIYPHKINTLLEEFQNHDKEFEIQFARGFDANTDDIDQRLLNEAKEKTTNANIVLLCIGLPDRYETEGVDRKHLNLPPNQLQLVDEIRSKNQNVVIILSIGSSVKLPFKNNVKGILCNWLLGEAGAGATFDVITGLFNPCGKLAESFLLNEQDDPSFGNYPGIDNVEYKEGILVGYRFHDYYKKELTYEFGYGLSYSTFEYSDLQVSKESIQENEELIVTLKVKNLGQIGGKEIMQLYISEKEPCVIRPPKELKAFKKIFLKPGEEKSVQFILNKRSFAYYNVKTRDWEVKSGTFTILIGQSSRNIVLNKDIIVTSSSGEKNLPGDEKVFIKRIYQKKSKKITRNTKMEDLKHHVLGNSIYKSMDKEMRKSLEGENLIDDEKALDDSSMKEFLNNIPLRALVNLSQGKGLSEKRMNQLLFILNRTRRDTLLGKFVGIFKTVKD